MIEPVFLVIYCVELLLRLFAYGVANIPITWFGASGKDPKTALPLSARGCVARIAKQDIRSAIV